MEVRGSKRSFLCCYDYGMGGVWVYLWARSKEEIERQYELVVVDEPPAWMDEERRRRTEERMTFDIDEPKDWILRIKRDKST